MGQHMVADALFRELDACHSGAVTPADVGAYLLKRGDEPSRVETLVSRLMASHGASVSLEAWRGSWQQWMTGEEGTAISAALAECEPSVKGERQQGAPHEVPSWSPRN